MKDTSRSSSHRILLNPFPVSVPPTPPPPTTITNRYVTPADGVTASHVSCVWILAAGKNLRCPLSFAVAFVWEDVSYARYYPLDGAVIAQWYSAGLRAG
jgi:hypothetical protein